MNYLFYYSLLECLYILYMYNLFKTYKNYNNFIEIFLQNNLFKNNETMIHSINKNEYSSKICKFGKFISVILAICIYIRYRLITNKKYQNIRFLTKLSIILVIIFSLILNMNAFIYLIPVFVYELYLINNNFFI